MGTHTHTHATRFHISLQEHETRAAGKKEKKNIFNLQGKRKFKSMNKHMMWLKRVVSFINSISQINECSHAQQVIYASTESLAFG